MSTKRGCYSSRHKQRHREQNDANPGESRVARCETFDPKRSTVGPVKRQKLPVSNAYVKNTSKGVKQKLPRLKSSAGKGKPGQHTNSLKGRMCSYG